MNLNATVFYTYFSRSGDRMYAFTVVYDGEGKLIHVLNAYDNSIIYSESQPT